MHGWGANWMDRTLTLRSVLRGHRASLVMSAALLMMSCDAHAETLSEAMASAYRKNTALQSQRLKARAIDERIPTALSGYRPRVAATASYGRVSRNSNLLRKDGSNDTYGYGVSIEQPLFDGFITKNAVKESESDVRAARQELRAFENEVLFETATSYLDVLRDEGIVLFRRKNLTALRREMVGVKARLERGQVTATDLDQARLRLANAMSDLEASLAALKISKLRYTRVTHLPAASLRMPGLPKAHLPKGLREAGQLALRSSPVIAAAEHKSRSAQHAVSRVFGELLPSATVSAGYDRSFNEPDLAARDDEQFSVVGRVRVPLYQGGSVSARVRAAKNTAASLGLDQRDTRLQISEAVSAAWAEMKSSGARVAADRRAEKASQRALAGIREEQRNGRRTVLDVLDAERDLVNARIRILQSTRDLHVSAYAVLRSIGHLTIDRFAPGTQRYDPSSYTRAVRNKWFGTTPPRTADDTLLGDDLISQDLLGEASPRSVNHETGQPLKLGWQTTVQSRADDGKGRP